MNLLRPIIIGAFALIALTASAQTQPAQNDPAIAQYSQANMNRIAAELSLNADQIAKYESLNEKVIQKIQAIQNDAQMTEAKKREFIRGNGEDHKRVMSTILTSNQFDTYLEIIQRRIPTPTNERKQVQNRKTN